jgi:hypothetical protein
MPFPALRVRLADPSHRLPMPGHARFFGSAGKGKDDLFDAVEVIDQREAFWLACLRDGSIVELEDEAPAPPSA